MDDIRGMITAPQPLAVDAGAKVLADGGNAVDAAVTAAFVQMVVTPRSCGMAWPSGSVVPAQQALVPVGVCGACAAAWGHW